MNQILIKFLYPQSAWGHMIKFSSWHYQQKILTLYLTFPNYSRTVKFIPSADVSTSTAWKVSKYGVISDPYFSAFGLNTEMNGAVNLRIQSEFKKIRTRNNSVFGHFSRSSNAWYIYQVMVCVGFETDENTELL